MAQAPGTEPPYRSWEDDHTALVHVLWDCGLHGEQADSIAGEILRSRWLAATKHRAAGGSMLCENGQPDGHSHLVNAGTSRCLQLPEQPPAAAAST